MTLPNILTILRILLTPIFIICLFYERLFQPHPYAYSWALLIFILASITDAYDGYYARKYNQITPSGRFLDPLADKILISSAFISFAVIGLIEYWMVALIVFRDLFVTGLRMALSHKGFTMLTSNIAKAKTVIQFLIIIFILTYLGIKSLSLEGTQVIFQFFKDYHVIYYFTFLVTVFTVYTGITYIYDNRRAIRQFFS